MFLLPHYPTTPNYLAGFQIKGGFSDEKKRKFKENTLSSNLGSPSAPRGRDIQPRGQGPEANYPTTPRSKRTDPPFLVSHAPPPPCPPGSGYTTPGSRAGGQQPHYPAVRAHWPPFPRLSRAPPPRRVLVSDPGVGAGGGVVRPRPREVASLVF